MVNILADAYAKSELPWREMYPSADGALVASAVGDFDGAAVGDLDGVTVGLLLGTAVGLHTVSFVVVQGVSTS